MGCCGDLSNANLIDIALGADKANDGSVLVFFLQIHKLMSAHFLSSFPTLLQVRHYKQTEASNTAGMLSMDDLRTQVREAKASCRDQTESARKELDYYKTRMCTYTVYVLV